MQRVPAAEFDAWAWRLPLLRSVILIVTGRVVRSKLEDSNDFKELVAANQTAKKPLGEAMKRYSGASMGYQFGSVLAGGIAPLVAVALLNAGNGGPGWVILYFSIIGIITVVATLLAPETLGKLDRRITAAQELDKKNERIRSGALHGN